MLGKFNPGFGIDRICLGHSHVDCPTKDDPSYDPPPPSRYICNICGEHGTHYVWNCNQRFGGRSWNVQNAGNGADASGKTQVAARAFTHPAEALKRWTTPERQIHPESIGDVSLPAYMEKRSFAASQRIPDALASELRHVPMPSIEFEKSVQYGVPLHEIGRLSP